MSISRISKAVAEIRRDQRFQESEDVRNKDIDLFLPAESCETIRRMAQIATALVLRCFTGRIRIHLPANDLALQSLLEEEARKLLALERLEFAPTESGRWRLALGCEIEDAVSADASGWTARVNGMFARRKPAAIPAIAFGVSCAVAKLFNSAIFGVSKNIDEAWDFCLLRFLIGNQVPEGVNVEVHLGRIGLLGAGAIGSAVGYILRLANWLARLEVIDFDIFEEPNLETCISADAIDVRRPLHKASSLAGTFKDHRVVATFRDRKILADDPLLKEFWDVFICGVDNGATRLILDNINARSLINAGLGGTQHDVGWVLWTRHGQGESTLSSIYEDSADTIIAEHVPEEFREECSRKNYEGISLALPFVALAAASLLVAAVYQNALGLRLTTNSLRIDLFGKQQRLTVS